MVVTHNMLNDIYNHWKHAETVRVKCLGVPTLDMENVIFHLEDLVPCILVTFDKEQVVIWRGQDYKPPKDTDSIPN
ncbi:unnamed protein product [Microthlaspi erraticum]|uniref:CRM domain-containing protein n=1 Tax=Microthlaspi erraticum TaxID=1685480 RepID=A0A6D2HTQ5_9BRAS|nr:unnamed protein product [Microthlaspi erraticum]